MASAQGTATVDFGSTPSCEASVPVTGQATISATSKVEPWIMGDESTGDNDANAHEALSFMAAPPVATARVAGTGFTITVRLLAGLATGQFKIQWAWSD